MCELDAIGVQTDSSIGIRTRGAIFEVALYYAKFWKQFMPVLSVKNDTKAGNESDGDVL